MTDKQLTSLPPLPNPPALVNPSDSQEAIMEQDSLVAQYNRLQESLMDSFDLKNREIEGELRRKDAEVKKLYGEKMYMGASLYQARSDVSVLNKTVAKTKINLSTLVNEKTVLEKEYEKGEKERRQMEAKIFQLEKELDSTKNHLQETLVKISQLQEINGHYAKMEATDDKAKQIQKDLEEVNSKNELLFNQKKALQSGLETQRSETLVAEKAVEKMHKEISQIESEKSSMQKQWEEAITAMSKRDKVFQALEDNKQVLASKCYQLENEVRMANIDRSNLTKELEQKKIECEQLQRKLTDLQDQDRQVIQKAKQLEESLRQSHTIEITHKNEIGDLKKEQAHLDTELSRKQDEVAAMKLKLKSMKNAFEEKLKVKVNTETAMREEILKEEADSELKIVERAGESKNLALRRVIENYKIQLSNKNNEILILKHDQKVLKEKHTDVSHHYSKLYEEAKHLIYSIERKEHDINFLKAKILSQEATLSGTFRLVFNKLNQELKESKVEVDKLRQIWLESQKDLLQSKNRITELEEENLVLNTRLGISDAVKSKTDLGVEALKKETFDQQVETAKLHGQIRRLQPIINDLQHAKSNLEEQLNEAKLKLEEAHINHNTSVMMLKDEIRRLMADRHALQKKRVEKEKSSSDFHSRVQLLQEMVDKLKTDRYDLQHENHALARKIQIIQRKLFDANTRIRSLEYVRNAASNKVAPAAEKADSISNSPESQSQSQSDQNLDNISPSPSLPLKAIPDFETWRLKIDCLQKEKDFLLNENKLLKERLTNLSGKLGSFKSELSASAEKSKMFQNTQAEYNSKINDLESKLSRAKKVAACMERQIKELKPNAKINYRDITDSEPSTQLLATLLARDIVI